MLFRKVMKNEIEWLYNVLSCSNSNETIENIVDTIHDGQTVKIKGKKIIVCGKTFYFDSKVSEVMNHTNKILERLGDM